MNLIRWSPFNDVMRLRNRIDRMFDEAYYPVRRGEDDELSFASNWNPAVDVYENGDGFVVNAELPGVEKKDISVDLKGRVLTLNGERSVEKEVNEDKFYRRERAFGKFQRSFTLPESVDAEKIKAEFKNGVLKVSIPKTEAQKPKQITVQ